MVGRKEPAQERDDVDDFADLDEWMARIRIAGGPPKDVELLHLRLAIARHPEAAREYLAALDRRRRPIDARWAP